MKILFLFFRPFYVLWCLLWFLALMFIVFPFVILASFWGRYAGGNAIFKALHFWSDIWFLMCGLRVSITYEVPHNLNKQYVFVANHISYLDAAMLVKIFRQPFRPLGKIELQSIPIFGYIYKQVVVLVNRSDAEASFLHINVNPRTLQSHFLSRNSSGWIHVKRIARA